MKFVSFFLALILASAGGLTLAAATRKAPAKKSSSTSAKKSAKSSKPAPKGGTSKSAKGSKSGSSKKGTTTAKAGKGSSRSRKAAIAASAKRRSRGQAAPTQERLMEIQEALATKGYLQSPASGVWDGDSVAALKRFQQDQNLSPHGKIDSLSLIALGLGPKRETASTIRAEQ